MQVGSESLDAAASHVPPQLLMLFSRPSYLALQVGSEAIDVAAFEQAAGVGVEVGPEQIKAAVAACIQENEAKLREER